MPTYPRVSTRVQRVTVAAESTWGTNPASGGYDLNPQAPALIPALEQAVLENTDIVRSGFVAPAPIAGVKGPGGPSFVFDIISWLSARAAAGTDAAPDGWMRRLLEAVVGEGAGVDTGGTFTAGSGMVCGGSTVASVGSAGANDQIVTITVASGHGSRFNPGCAIVVVHNGEPYPMIVTGVSTDTLTVFGGPTEAGSGIAASDVVYGTHSVVLPVNDSAAAKDMSITAEIVDSAGSVFQWMGCSGNLKMEFTAAEKGVATFDFEANEWTQSAATLAGGTAWPAANRRRNVGVSGRVRIGAAGDDVSYPYTLLEATEHYSAASLDLGVQRVQIDALGGTQGRAGRPIQSIAPMLTTSGYFRPEVYAYLGSPGAVQTGRAVSLIFGDATNGGVAVFMPNARLASQPTHSDSGGLVAQDLVWTPDAVTGNLAQLYIIAW